jgi:hypothetical protein
MSSFQPIKRLPISKSSAFVDVNVRMVGTKEALFWDKNVQPYIQAQNRLDATWRWPSLFSRYGKLESLSGRAVSLFQIGIPTSIGTEAPLGLMLLAENYPFLQGVGDSVFIWFLATSPTQALAKLGVTYSKPEMLLPALIDTAIQRSIELGYEGRIGLHAAPNPGDQKRHTSLYTNYRDTARLKALPKSTKVNLSLGRALRVPNDGRYFFANEKLAQALSNSLDYLR